MNKVSGELEEGELFDESFDFKQITWKFSKAVSLPHLVDSEVNSPAFSFACATWRLVLYPYGTKKYVSEGNVDLDIIRLNSRFPEHYMFLNFYFKIADGTIFSRFSDIYKFTTQKCFGGVANFMDKSELNIYQDIIAANEVFTIMCQMEIKKIDVIDRYSQIESITCMFDDSSKQDPESSASSYKGCNSTSKDPMALSGVKALTDFKELFLKQEDCDMIFKVKGQEFPAHRAILRARCLVFASTFRNDMKEKATGVIEIEDCDPSSFSDFLCFLYCGNVGNLTTENVFSLFSTADKYDVQDLRSQCMEFIKNNLSIRSFCNTVSLSLQYSEEELLQLSIDFLAKNLQEVIMTVEWQKLLIESPIQCNELMIKALKSNKN